jgi:hypothetical protein
MTPLGSGRLVTREDMYDGIRLPAKEDPYTLKKR